MNISQAIKNCPKSIFSTGKGEDRRPNYSGVFAYVASAILEANGIEHDRDTIVRVAEAINLSSLQRMIAQEAARRRDGDGEPLTTPKAAPKAPEPKAPAPKGKKAPKAPKADRKKARAAKVEVVKAQAVAKARAGKVAAEDLI